MSDSDDRMAESLCSMAMIGCLASGVLVLGLACTIAPAHVQAAQESTDLQTGLAEDFSDGIDAWRKQRLDRRLTEYRIIDIDGNSVLEAASHNAAAALLMPVDRHSISQGRLRWRWRVMTSLTENLRETEKDGDDYAARVFVLFGDAEFGEGTRALAYAWAGHVPVGSRYPNPYTSEVSTIVLRSGNQHAGEWMIEDRDIMADYARAFGEPPPELAAIALLVDTDDTGGTAMAWFDDIELLVALAP